MSVTVRPVTVAPSGSGRCRWTWWRIQRVAHQTIRPLSTTRRAARRSRYIIPIVAIPRTAPAPVPRVQRGHPDDVLNRTETGHATRFILHRRQGSSRLVIRRHRGVHEARATDLEDVGGEEGGQHQHNDDYDERLLVRLWHNSSGIRLTDLGTLIRAVRTVLPSVAEIRGRNANIVLRTLELLRGFAAIHFVIAARAVRGAIANESAVDAVATLTAKLIRMTRRTPLLVRSICAVVLAITTPRRRNAILVHRSRHLFGTGGGAHEEGRSTDGGHSTGDTIV